MKELWIRFKFLCWHTWIIMAMMWASIIGVYLYSQISPILRSNLYGNGWIGALCFWVADISYVILTLWVIVMLGLKLINNTHKLAQDIKELKTK